MSDLQHAQAAEQSIGRWTEAVVAPDGSHHLLEGLPMYAARFAAVQRFHSPGLAPASDATGAFHIDPFGHPAYEARFQQTWGFYENLAAVEGEDGWCHVRPDGEPLSPVRFAWCGNFQEHRCTVRDDAGRYFHVRPDGSSAYSARHLYTGDFREGAAVVREALDGLCCHIDIAGNHLHDRRFIDLDVFHKGFARARDERGWFHVDRRGRTAYSHRFAAIEPFYNGFALAERFEGERVVVDQSGTVTHTVVRTCCR